MPQPPLTPIERAIAERALLRARRNLIDLVDFYHSGNWRYFKHGSFAHEVRRARLAVDHWVEVCNGRRRDGAQAAQ